MTRKKFFEKIFFDNEPLVQKKIITIPNIITSIGIILTIFYVLMYATHTLQKLIPVIIFLIGFSDFLDGIAARLLNQHSVLGKFLDPARDRMLMIAVLVNMILIINSYVVLIWLIIVFEISIISIHAIAKYKYNLNIGVHALGKFRLLVHMISAELFVIIVYWPSWWAANGPAQPIIDTTLLLFIMLIASMLAAFSYLGKLISSQK